MRFFDEQRNTFAVVETYILRSDIIFEHQEVPIYEIDVFAGIKSEYVEDMPPLENIEIPNIPKVDGAFHVRGDSMAPLLRQGDYVFCKLVPNRRGGLFFGNMYLVAFTIDGEDYVTVKYLHQSEKAGYYRIESLNPAYPPLEIPIDSVKALAIVKASLRFETIG